MSLSLSDLGQAANQELIDDVLVFESPETGDVQLLVVYSRTGMFPLRANRKRELAF
jgi:hypothetical protein